MMNESSVEHYYGDEGEGDLYSVSSNRRRSSYHSDRVQAAQVSAPPSANNNTHHGHGSQNKRESFTRVIHDHVRVPPRQSLQTAHLLSDQSNSTTATENDNDADNDNYNDNNYNMRGIPPIVTEQRVITSSAIPAPPKKTAPLLRDSRNNVGPRYAGLLSRGSYTPSSTGTGTGTGSSLAAGTTDKVNANTNGSAPSGINRNSNRTISTTSSNTASSTSSISNNPYHNRLPPTRGQDQGITTRPLGQYSQQQQPQQQHHHSTTSPYTPQHNLNGNNPHLSHSQSRSSPSSPTNASVSVNINASGSATATAANPYSRQHMDREDDMDDSYTFGTTPSGGRRPDLTDKFGLGAHGGGGPAVGIGAADSYDPDDSMRVHDPLMQGSLSSITKHSDKTDKTSASALTSKVNNTTGTVLESTANTARGATSLLSSPHEHEHEHDDRYNDADDYYLGHPEQYNNSNQYDHNNHMYQTRNFPEQYQHQSAGGWNHHHQQQQQRQQRAQHLNNQWQQQQQYQQEHQYKYGSRDVPRSKSFEHPYHSNDDRGDTYYYQEDHRSSADYAAKGPSHNQTQTQDRRYQPHYSSYQHEPSPSLGNYDHAARWEQRQRQPQRSSLESRDRNQPMRDESQPADVTRPGSSYAGQDDYISWQRPRRDLPSSTNGRNQYTKDTQISSPPAPAAPASRQSMPQRSVTGDSPGRSNNKDQSAGNEVPSSVGRAAPPSQAKLYPDVNVTLGHDDDDDEPTITAILSALSNSHDEDEQPRAPQGDQDSHSGESVPDNPKSAENDAAAGKEETANGDTPNKVNTTSTGVSKASITSWDADAKVGMDETNTDIPALAPMKDAPVSSTTANSARAGLPPRSPVGGSRDVDHQRRKRPADAPAPDLQGEASIDDSSTGDILSPREKWFDETEREIDQQDSSQHETTTDSIPVNATTATMNDSGSSQPNEIGVVQPLNTPELGRVSSTVSATSSLSVPGASFSTDNGVYARKAGLTGRGLRPPNRPGDGIGQDPEPSGTGNQQQTAHAPPNLHRHTSVGGAATVGSGSSSNNNTGNSASPVARLRRYQSAGVPTAHNNGGSTQARRVPGLRRRESIDGTAASAISDNPTPREPQFSRFESVGSAVSTITAGSSVPGASFSTDNTFIARKTALAMRKNRLEDTSMDGSTYSIGTVDSANTSAVSVPGASFSTDGGAYARKAGLRGRASVRSNRSFGGSGGSVSSGIMEDESGNSIPGASRENDGLQVSSKESRHTARSQDSLRTVDENIQIRSGDTPNSSFRHQSGSSMRSLKSSAGAGVGAGGGALQDLEDSYRAKMNAIATEGASAGTSDSDQLQRLEDMYRSKMNAAASRPGAVSSSDAQVPDAINAKLEQHFGPTLESQQQQRGGNFSHLRLLNPRRSAEPASVPPAVIGLGTRAAQDVSEELDREEFDMEYEAEVQVRPVSGSERNLPRELTVDRDVALEQAVSASARGNKERQALWFLSPRGICVALFVITGTLIAVIAVAVSKKGSSSGDDLSGDAFVDSLPQYSRAVLDEKDPDSPQYMAYQWLQEEELFLSYPMWRKQQRFALVTIYFALYHNSDEEDGDLPWFQIESNECEWLWDADEQSICGSSGRYKTLSLRFDYRSRGGVDIPNFGFGEELSDCLSNGSTNSSNCTVTDIISPSASHEIPAEIALLSLERLNVAHVSSDTQLAQMWPKELASMTQLTQLTVKEAPGITGTIPTNVGLFKNLEILSIEGTSAKGGIPTEIGLCSNLREAIIMENARLTGILPSELGVLSSLELLWIFDNPNLSGPIPTELGLFKGLLWLSLAGNDLTSTIPSELGLVTLLTELRLGRNDLSGTIPAELGALSKLRALDVNHNDKLLGTMPLELCYLSPIAGYSFKYFADCSKVVCCDRIQQ